MRGSAQPCPSDSIHSGRLRSFEEGCLGGHIGRDAGSSDDRHEGPGTVRRLSVGRIDQVMLALTIPHPLTSSEAGRRDRSSLEEHRLV